MVVAVKFCLKAFSNVFYLAFPIIFAQCVYYTNVLESPQPIFDSIDNINLKEKIIKNVKQKNSEENIQQFLIITIIESIPMFLFKVFIVVFLVGLYKSKTLEKLLKMGII